MKFLRVSFLTYLATLGFYYQEQKLAFQTSF